MSDRYQPTEFDVIKYFASSGGLSCPDAMSRMSYYGIGGYPTVVWQGTQFLVGAGTDVIDGAPYDAIVQNHLADATPWIVEIDDFSFTGSPFADVTVTLDDDVADVSGHYLRVFLVENDCTADTVYDDVLRVQIGETPITIDMAGQSQSLSMPFVVDPTWKVADLRVVAMVQEDAGREVLQLRNSLSPGPYAFRYYSLGERVVIDNGTHEYGEFALFNVGELSDTYELTLDTADLPAGWTAWITDGVDDFPSVDVTLAPGERATYNVVVQNSSAGGGGVMLKVHSQGGGTDDRQVSYSLITADTEILLVDDDGAESFESDYYEPALAGVGRSVATWDRGAASLTGDILSNFDAVVWNVGFAFPTLDDADRAALGAFLDGGGSLFVSGQDVGWDLNDQGGAAYTWYRNYLHANFQLDDTNDYTLDGVAGDPITDGLSITIQGGDGANNQEYPDAITPYDAMAEPILKYSASLTGALRSDAGTYRVVYLGFGFEAISNATDRAALMEAAIDWLLPDLTNTDTAPLALRLDQNLPNPFNPKTDIRFALPSAGDVTLEVFDVEGRRVRVLAEGHHVAGEHTVTWDGRDDAGTSVSSGMYFYRLAGDTETRTRKMLLLK